MKNALYALIALSLSASALAGQPVMDRKLNRQELRALLPQYVAMVESQAASLPSAEQKRQLNLVVAGIENNTFVLMKDGKIVGRQAHGIDSHIESLEQAVAELKAVSPRDRVEAAADLVAGFKGGLGAGRISCTLGYAGQFKQQDERIVKCTDDRSRKGSGDDEGFADIRSFTLSIDAKTLAPLSTLELDHLQAG